VNIKKGTVEVRGRNKTGGQKKGKQKHEKKREEWRRECFVGRDS